MFMCLFVHLLSLSCSVVFCGLSNSLPVQQNLIFKKRSKDQMLCVLAHVWDTFSVRVYRA